MSRGWIPAHRKIYEPDHWLAPTKRDPSNRRDAWLDLCQMATHTERETANSGTLERGEVVVSVRKASERWCWSKSRVSRFMSDLEDRDAIKEVRGTPDGTVYLIANYDTYAVGEIAERDTSAETEISGTPSAQNAGQAAGHPGSGVSDGTPTDSGIDDQTSGTGSGTKTGHRAGQEQEGIKHSNNRYTSDFEDVWGVSRRGSKKKAFAQYRKAVPDKIEHYDLLAAWEAMVSHASDDRFIPHLWRWIRDERWVEDLPATNGTTEKKEVEGWVRL